jgi:hypothetical protein
MQNTVNLLTNLAKSTVNYFLCVTGAASEITYEKIYRIYLFYYFRTVDLEVIRKESNLIVQSLKTL